MRTFSLNNHYICTDNGKEFYISQYPQHRIDGLPIALNDVDATIILNDFKEELKHGKKSLINNLDGTYFVI